MMNICSTCQGAQSECQQRLDADSAYRAHINETLAEEGLAYDPEGFSNKNFLWVLVEDYGLDRLGEQVTRPLGACGSAPSTAATSSGPSTGSATRSTPSATSISTG